VGSNLIGRNYVFTLAPLDIIILWEFSLKITISRYNIVSLRTKLRHFIDEKACITYAVFLINYSTHARNGDTFFFFPFLSLTRKRAVRANFKGTCSAILALKLQFFGKLIMPPNSVWNFIRVNQVTSNKIFRILNAYMAGNIGIVLKLSQNFKTLSHKNQSLYTSI